MCTAATYKTKDFYFGRTLDYEFSYGDEVTITPRNYPFHFKEKGSMNSHYAIIGMAYVTENYPLYYDAMNEKGLGMAGLNCVGNAFYRESAEGKDNIAQYEFIPWILSQCTTVKEAKELINNINLLNIPFNDNLPLAQLHWIISDKLESITVEPLKDGIKITITLKKDANAQVVLNNLYKHTNFQINYGIILLMLDNGVPRTLGLKSIISKYIDHQKEVIIRRTKYDLAQDEARVHILEGLKIALDNIDEVVSIIRGALDDEDARNKLMKYGKNMLFF